MAAEVYSNETRPAPAAPYLSPRQVADRLGLADSDNVLAWINAGELRASNVGTGSKRPRWRVAVADLDAFLARRLAVPAPPAVGQRKRRARPVDVTPYFSEC